MANSDLGFMTSDPETPTIINGTKFQENFIFPRISVAILDFLYFGFGQFRHRDYDQPPPKPHINESYKNPSEISGFRDFQQPFWIFSVLELAYSDLGFMTRDPENPRVMNRIRIPLTYNF